MAAIPLTPTDWDRLMNSLTCNDLKEWLHDQPITGAIRLMPNMTQEICKSLGLSSANVTKLILIRLDEKASSNGESPDKSMEALTSCKSSGLPCQLLLPSGSELNVDDLLLSYLQTSYTYTRYKTNTSSSYSPIQLATTTSQDMASLVSSIYWCQDLISTPARDLSPTTFQEAAEEWANERQVSIDTIVGDDLLSYNGSLTTSFGCGMIHAVGQASSDRPPRLIRMTYEPIQGSTKCIGLIGKGVTFDTGGLNLKTGDSMLSMKKDMGGAAHALALFRLLVETHYPLSIKLWLPIVENAIGSKSYRPGDILTAVNGMTTEIGNTDAEGRLILGDALALASAENPSLIIDFATLTGAARSALGTDVPALFSNQRNVQPVLHAAQKARDPLWPLPLWEGYRSRMKGKIADFGNVANDNGLGGAITAALYLSEFVNNNIPWYHLDLHGLDKEGRGRAQGVHAMYEFLTTYAKKR